MTNIALGSFLFGKASDFAPVLYFIQCSLHANADTLGKAHRPFRVMKPHTYVLRRTTTKLWSGWRLSTGELIHYFLM